MYRILKKTIRYFIIIFGTITLTLFAFWSFIIIRDHLDSYTEVASSFSVPQSSWVIENKVTRSNSTGALGGSSAEVIALNQATGEQVTLLSGAEVNLSVSMEEQNKVVITLPKISAVNVKANSFGAFSVNYNFAP